MVALGVGAALALGACQTDREVTRPEPEPVTEELAGDALLTVEDLPEGWAVSDEATPIATEVLPEHPCDDALADLEPEVDTSTDFTGPGGTLSSGVAHFPGQGAAAEQLVRDIAEDCAAVVATDSGVSVRTSPLDFGVLSDDTLALRFEIEPQTGAITERDLIVIRRGDLVSTIRLDGPRPSDKALLDSVVRVAIGRLGTLALLTE
jgi:hypothetical protein